MVFLAGGMGEPGFSTDVPAVHTAIEIGADAVLMMKNGVEGILEADPREDPRATLIPEISASEALA